MTRPELEKLLEEKGIPVQDFDNWIYGQTIGSNPDGSYDYYDSDVARFVRRYRPK